MNDVDEAGRSMVEMLGVLAIIGVLSIGGIAGYTMAMNRYRANEALDMATKYATVMFAMKQAYAVTHGGKEENYGVPNLYTMGLTTNSQNPEETGTGAIITPPPNSDIKENGVKLTITFQTLPVCRAAASILGIDPASGCRNTSLTYTFIQS